MHDDHRVVEPTAPTEKWFYDQSLELAQAFHQKQQQSYQRYKADHAIFRVDGTASFPLAKLGPKFLIDLINSQKHPRIYATVPLDASTDGAVNYTPWSNEPAQLLEQWSREDQVGRTDYRSTQPVFQLLVQSALPAVFFWFDSAADSILQFNS